LPWASASVPTRSRSFCRRWHAEIFLGQKGGPGGFEKELVIKRIAKKLLGDREIEHMFIDEARVQALLDHPNIVQIYDFGEERGSYYMAMELVRGATLRWVIDNAAAVRRPIPMQHALRIAADVLCGLHYAHERVDDKGAPLKLIHRDISPVNVLISRAGIAKLCEFGVAKSEIPARHDARRHRQGQVPLHVPPSSSTRSRWTDAPTSSPWARCSGRCCRGDASLTTTARTTVVAAIRKGDYPAPSSVRPGIPRPIDRILRKALHPNRDKRFKSARDFQLACEEIPAHAAERVQLGAGGGVRERRDRRHRRARRAHAAAAAHAGERLAARLGLRGPRSAGALLAHHHLEPAAGGVHG
jgi:hypothetical protein